MTNTILGDGAALDATLEKCTVIGRDAGQRATGFSSEIIGDSAGYAAHVELSAIRGQYAGRYSRVIYSTIDGYGIEFADVVRSVLVGLYAGHSCAVTESIGEGIAALQNAIGTNLVAQGRDAGVNAEGSNLTMIGQGVTTAFVAGASYAVTVLPAQGEIGLAGSLARWRVPGHGWPVGSRRNFAMSGAVLPACQVPGAWIANVPYPFTVLDADHLIYTGNKYVARTAGSAVRLVENANRPSNSTAIGAGSRITRSNQLVINGVDVTARMQ